MINVKTSWNLFKIQISTQTDHLKLRKADHTLSNILKAVFHKFYLVHSWILFPVSTTCTKVFVPLEHHTEVLTGMQIQYQGLFYLKYSWERQMSIFNRLIISPTCKLWIVPILYAVLTTMSDKTSSFLFASSNCFLYFVVTFIRFSYSMNVFNYSNSLSYFFFFFLIGIHSMQDWTETTRYGVARKRCTQRLKHSVNLFRKNLHLPVTGVC